MSIQEDREALMAAIQRLGRLMGSRQVSSRLADAADADVGQQGIQILRALLRSGELPIAGLASAAQMDIAAVSRQLRPLEDSGLVRRASAAADGRVALVSLTAAGDGVARKIKEVGMAHLAESMSDWSNQDTTTMARLLTRLVDDLHATDIAPPHR